MAMLPAAAFIGNPLGGALADRIGPRDALRSGLILAAAGSVAVVFVDSAAHAFAAAALLGLGASVCLPAQDALLASVVDPEHRPAVFSVSHATLNAGLGVGALIAALVVDLDDPGSFTVLYLLDAATFLAFVPLLQRLPAHRPARDTRAGEGAPGSYRLVLRDRVFLRVWVLIALLITVGYGQYYAAFPAFATRPGGISPGALSLAFAANTLTVVGAQLVALRLLDGARRTRGVVVAAGGWAVAWALTLAAGQLGGGAAARVGFVAAMVVFALAETMIAPTIPVLVNDLAPDELRGRYNGCATLAWSTGFFLGPVMAGFALGAGAATGLFVGLIGGCALVAATAVRLERHLAPETNLVSGTGAH